MEPTLAPGAELGASVWDMGEHQRELDLVVPSVVTGPNRAPPR
jgi:hypothetical protein